jgi:hypothetical protein
MIQKKGAMALAPAPDKVPIIYKMKPLDPRGSLADERCQPSFFTRAASRETFLEAVFL